MVIEEISSDENTELESDFSNLDQTDDSSADTEPSGDWYIVQCYSGQEFSVKTRIESLSEEDSFKNVIFRVLVPTEDTVEIKNNKRIEKTVRMYPGYVFINMSYNDDVFYALRQLPGVSKFIGTHNRPTIVQEDEILKVLRKVGDKTKRVDVDFEIGESIKVESGPFRGYTGPISEINPEKGNLKAKISIFGRETPVKLDFDQVEKIVK